MAGIRRIATVSVIAALVGLIAFVAGWLVGRTGIGSVVEPSSLTEAERAFSERMRDVVLVGVFTVDGREPHNPQPDRYEIESVDPGVSNLRFQYRTTSRVRDLQCLTYIGTEGPIICPICREGLQVPTPYWNTRVI